MRGLGACRGEWHLDAAVHACARCTGSLSGAGRGRRSDGRKAGEQGLKCRRKGRLRPPQLAGDAHIRPAALIARQPLSWRHLSRRDLLRQSPKHDVTKRGTFAIRSPLRPNPIGTGIVTFIGREGPVLAVRGLDCLDGTPLLDLKPARDGFVPPAPPTPGDAETG
jgi:hypothetical protein